MNKHFRLHLTLVMIIFAVFITFFVAFFDQTKMKEKLIDEHIAKLVTAEERIMDSLHTIDQVYLLFDSDIAEEMKRYSNELLALYETNPNVEDWDFAALKEKYGMDIYILNDHNVIVNSSFQPDIGRIFIVAV